MFYDRVVHETWQELDGVTMHLRQADTDPERVQLHREATMLGLARHPAVVEVVASDEDGGRLVTRVGARHTLDHGPRPGSRGWLRALAGATQTVADLHALGLVHGDLRADRIWVDDRGHPVLDGFSQAGLAGQSVDGGPPLRPSSDVAALATMAVMTVTDAVDSPRAGPARRSEHGRRSGRRTRGPNRVTGPGAELAAVLAAGRAGGWPPARRLAQALDAELARITEAAPVPEAPPSADLGPAAEPDPDPDPFGRLRPKDAPSPRRRAPRPSALALSLALVGVVALGWGATRVAARASRPTLAPSPAPVLSIAGTSYRIGQAGDQVEVGSWGCGATRAVVLRPGTGEVFAFDGWARSGHDLTARVVAQVSRGSRLVAIHQPRGCDGLAAAAPGRARVDLDGAVTR